MAIADHARETTGGARMGASATTTVLSVLPPRIMPPYSPRYMTSRPSSVAARASTCAASCTPWPPMPVMRSSRSMADSCETECDEALHLLRLWVTAMRDRVVHAREREFADERRVLIGAAERANRRRERREELGARGSEIVRVTIGEPRAVDREGARGVRRDRVAGLSEHAFDPAPYLRFGIGGGADPRVQVVDKLTLSVGEHREQQRVLRREVAVEGLVREPRGLDEVAHLRIDVAGGAHHRERGVDEAPDLDRVLPAALRQS